MERQVVKLVKLYSSCGTKESQVKNANNVPTRRYSVTRIVVNVDEHADGSLLPRLSLRLRENKTTAVVPVLTTCKMSCVTLYTDYFKSQCPRQSLKPPN